MADLNISKDLLDILSSRIKKFEKGLRRQLVIDPKKEVITKLIEDIKNDPYILATLDKKELLDYFTKYLVGAHVIEIDELTAFFEKRYNLAAAVARGYTQGINIKYDQEEMATVNKLIEYLSGCVEVIDRFHQDGIARYNSEKDSHSLYYSLYDKLRSEEELEFFTEEEIGILHELIKDRGFAYFKEVMKYIYEYNRRVLNNKSLQAEDLLDDVTIDNKDKKKYSIDEGVLKSIFEEFGFTYDGMPDDIFNAILDSCDAERIRDIFGYINSNPSYHFLKDYGKKDIIKKKPDGSEFKIPKNNNLIRRQFVILFQIIRYSNISILRYLERDCDDKDVDLEEVILKVKGVVKHVSHKRGRVAGESPSTPVDDLHVTGTFENYRANSEELIKLSKEHGGVDYLQYAINCEKYSTVLGVDADRFKTNLGVLKQYGFKFEILENAKTVEKMPWFGALVIDTNLLLNRIDVLIENGVRNGNRDESFAYALSYPSVLYYDQKLLEAIVYNSYSDDLEYLPNGKLKKLRQEIFSVSEDYYKTFIFRKNLEIERQAIPEKYVQIAETATETDFSFSDEYIERLMPYIVGSESKIGGLAYDINGVIVSLPKVLRIWKAIKKAYDNDFDLDQLFMYTLTYGSYYVDSELQELKSVINERKFG